YSEVSVVGITEVLKRLPSLTRAMRHLVDEAQRRKPPLAILTDFPGFHLRLARKLRPRGIRNVYYICPQFWAWRPWRVNLVRRRFAEALCIFHFEEKFYADAGVPVKFIGHPLVGSVSATLTRELFCRKYGLEDGAPIITVLPGSRLGEIAHHLPILVEGLGRIRRRMCGAPQIVVAVAPGLDAARLEKNFPTDWRVRLISNDTYNALAAADLAIVSSGTATIETALLGKPMVVVYRVSSLTAHYDVSADGVQRGGDVVVRGEKMNGARSLCGERRCAPCEEQREQTGSAKKPSTAGHRTPFHTMHFPNQLYT